jgi:hypothetical protein
MAKKETPSDVEMEFRRGMDSTFLVIALVNTLFQWNRVKSPGTASRESRVSANCQTKESSIIFAKGMITIKKRTARRIMDIIM